MIPRSVLVVLGVATMLSGAAMAAEGPVPSPASAPGMPTVPSHQCVKPQFPGRGASSMRISAFNREFSVYTDCIKKYVEATKALMNAAIAAGNAAVDEFNAYTTEIKAQSEPKEAQ